MKTMSEDKAHRIIAYVLSLTKKLKKVKTVKIVIFFTIFDGFLVACMVLFVDIDFSEGLILPSY